MKVLLRTLVIFVVALPFLAIAAVLMCFQDRPLVSRSVQLTPQDIERAKRIIDEHDPRKTGATGLQTIAIDQLETAVRELNAVRRSSLALQADKKASFGMIIQVMDALKLAGVRNLPAFTRE